MSTGILKAFHLQTRMKDMGNQDNNGCSSPVNKKPDSAITRLAQLTEQVAPQPKSRRQQKIKSAEGPADWSDVLTEFDDVRRRAQTPRVESTGYRRHKEAGKLWVRERIELLLDKDSFREVGSTAGTATWTKLNPSSKSILEAEKEKVTDFTPSNNVQGTFNSDPKPVF